MAHAETYSCLERLEMHITIGSYFTEVDLNALSKYNIILANIKVDPLPLQFLPSKVLTAFPFSEIEETCSRKRRVSPVRTLIYW